MSGAAHLQLDGQLAEPRDVHRLGQLQDVVDVSDLGLLQLLADVHQLGAAIGPEGQLLQRPAGRALLGRLLVAQQLLDLIRPVDHDDCNQENKNSDGEAFCTGQVTASWCNKSS